MFHDAIKARYPDMNIVASVAVTEWTNPRAGILEDIHLYLTSTEMIQYFSWADNFPRDHGIFVGEYAAIKDRQGGDVEINEPTLESATSEAVMILGLERNSDVVRGFAHGALLKSLHDEPDNHVAMMKHAPETIVYSLSYYVAKLFSTNYGTETVATSGDSGFGPLYWSTTKNDSGTYFVKIVNYDGAESTPITVDLPGNTRQATLKTFTAPNQFSTNTLGNTQGVWSETTIQRGSDGFTFTLAGRFIVAVLVV
jgi:alpha-N-arabinofuranosidase